MELFIFLIIIGFIVIIQAAVPYLLKRTLAFGVTIPEGHTDNQNLLRFKKQYTAVILIVGLLSMFIYFFWAKNTMATKDIVVLTGLAVQFGILLLSMALYLLFHAKTTNLKKSQHWGADLKQVRIADLTSRSKDEMLPSTLYLLPMIITVGLIAYTATQYAIMPDLIPTHWGPDGKADAFSQKSPFSVIALLLILLVMQGMMFSFNLFIKRSGIKLNAAKSKSSQVQQLSFRKYTSWFLLLMTFLSTILIGFLQLTTIHEGLGNAVIMLVAPLGFLLLTLIGTAVYAFKVGQSGTRINVAFEEEKVSGITDIDDDTYWKAGVFYVNKNDPSIFVEKRFGVGWTMNFGQPIAYLIIFVPLLLIIGISILL